MQLLYTEYYAYYLVLQQLSSIVFKSESLFLLSNLLFSVWTASRSLCASKEQVDGL